MAEYRTIPIDRIVPDPNQPRKTFNPESIKELAQTFHTHSVIDPIIVKPMGAQLMIIIGERRYRAALEVGLKEIPCLIREGLSELEVRELQAIEEYHREPVPIPERDEAWKRLWDAGHPERYPSVAAFARVLGVDDKVPGDAFKRLSYSLDIREAFKTGELQPSLAREVSAGIEDKETQEALLRKAKAQEIGKTQMREIVKTVKEAPEPIKQKLISHPTYTIEDARAEMEHLKRVEEAKKLFAERPKEPEPAMALFEVGSKLENQILDLSITIDSLLKQGVIQQFGEGTAKSIMWSLNKLEANIRELKEALAPKYTGEYEKLPPGEIIEAE